MYRYAGFSITIDSEFELPELSAGFGNPDVLIRIGAVDPREKSATVMDEVICRDVARFRVKGGCEIVVDPVPGADAAALRAVLLGKLMAYLMRQRGCLPLHASGVVIDGCAVLFLGESGAGKSTTAAALYARGHRVIADDVGAVRAVGRGIELQSAWSGLRLLDDARPVIGSRASPLGFQDNKHVFHLERHASGRPLAVRRIYFLAYETPENGRTVRTDVITGFPAVALLNSNSFLGTWQAGSELLQANLERSASIASSIPVHRLVRPRSLDCLPALADFVEKDVMAHD
jgi:hypothetical protein